MFEEEGKADYKWDRELKNFFSPVFMFQEVICIETNWGQYASIPIYML